MEGGTLSNSTVDFLTHDVLWAGDCKYRLNIAAIEAKNSMIVKSKGEYYPSQTSHLDNKFLLSLIVIYQGIPNKFEVLVG
jgi:hypothetical protein